jgi:hypothetical protein
VNVIPFAYPDFPHVRRHGPSGYKAYDRFRPWLRDEFLFRCVYCLKREQWGIVRNHYALDHFLPQARFPSAVLDYDNLLYSCITCNSAKRDAIVPDPCRCMLQGRVVVYENGSIVGNESESKRLIRQLGLDDPEYCEFRRMWIDIVALSRQHDSDMFRRLMGFPERLPDLSRLRPPKNSRPKGIRQSCYASRARLELPTTY